MSPGHRSGDELLEAAGRRPLGRPRQRELRGFCGRGICLMNGSLERRDGPCLHTKLQAKIGLVWTLLNHFKAGWYWFV